MDDEDLFEEEDVFDARPLWLQLPVRLLNERGKRVVSADPDLRKETMEALMRVHPPKGCYEFYFGNHDFESDVGATGLAMCIADNPLANMAELVARYAAMRKIPFTDTALAVLSDIKGKMSDMLPANAWAVWNSTTPMAFFIMSAKTSETTL